MNIEDYTEEDRRELKVVDRWVMAILAALVLLICCSGCRSVQYVPIETVKHDSIYLSKLQRDSIYLKEYVNVYQKADTVYKERIITKYKERLSTDTLYIERTDTIRQVIEVEKPLTRNQRTMINLGWCFVGSWSLAILLIAAYLIFKRKI